VTALMHLMGIEALCPQPRSSKPAPPQGSSRIGCASCRSRTATKSDLALDRCCCGLPPAAEIWSDPLRRFRPIPQHDGKREFFRSSCPTQAASDVDGVDWKA
jgi:hypothetical protein